MRAEMNGYDFNRRVLKPWARDPAFYNTIWTYRSDVPGHEGPTHHALVELWTYDFPLSDAEQQRLACGAKRHPAADEAGAAATSPATRATSGLPASAIFASSARRWTSSRRKLGNSASDELADVIDACQSRHRRADRLAGGRSRLKDRPSGIGKENYTWYQQNVHLVPLTWEDEVRLLKRELARAWSSLKLEEQRNRDLPPMVAASTPGRI